MNTKIADFSEMKNILSVKSETDDEIIILFDRFVLGNQLRHLFLEKYQVSMRLRSPYHCAFSASTG